MLRSQKNNQTVGEVAFLKLFNSMKMLGGGAGRERKKGLFNHLIRIFKVIKQNHNFETMYKNCKCQKGCFEKNI